MCMGVCVCPMFSLALVSVCLRSNLIFDWFHLFRLISLVATFMFPTTIRWLQWDVCTTSRLCMQPNMSIDRPNTARSVVPRSALSYYGSILNSVCSTASTRRTMDLYDPRSDNYGMLPARPSPPGLNEALDRYRQRPENRLRDPACWHAPPPACLLHANSYSGYWTDVARCGNLLCWRHGLDVARLAKKISVVRSD